MVNPRAGRVSYPNNRFDRKSLGGLRKKSVAIIRGTAFGVANDFKSGDTTVEWAFGIDWRGDILAVAHWAPPVKSTILWR
jgi:hypothetical protein